VTAQALVGRDDELRALDQVLRQAREGATRCVVVGGEPVEGAGI
jgi:hypothetical protein